MLTLIIWLLLALTLAAAWATWALHGKRPGHLWLGCYMPVTLLAWLRALGNWLDSDGLGEADPLTRRMAAIGLPEDAVGPPPKEAFVPSETPRPLPPPPPPPPAGADVPYPGPAPEEEPRSFGGAQSDLLHGIESIVRMASSGDLRHVRRAIKTLAVAADALGHGARHLSRRLAEPDKHYGSEIWEPLGVGGQQMQSSALHLGYSDAMLASLGRTTIDEISDSPRQAPHHSQLNGPV